MKRFETSLAEFQKHGDTYILSGKNAGDEPIVKGDFLNHWEVRRIESYHHDLAELPPGMSARLTLVRRSGTDHFPLLLTASPVDGPA